MSPSGSDPGSVPDAAVNVSFAEVFVYVEETAVSEGESSTAVTEIENVVVNVPPVGFVETVTVRLVAGASDVLRYVTSWATFVATESFTLLPKTRTLSM